MIAEPRIETLAGKKLIGQHVSMSFSKNLTFELWSGFMPHRKEIKNSIGSDLYSLEIYGKQYFDNFNPDRLFVKWAAIEVTDFKSIPPRMQAYTLEGGLYAVFLYKGAASTAAATFRYILGTWVPNSGYDLDDRPHFEILGEKYKREDPDSEEELWIPIRQAQISNHKF